MEYGTVQPMASAAAAVSAAAAATIPRAQAQKEQAPPGLYWRPPTAPVVAGAWPIAAFDFDSTLSLHKGRGPSAVASCALMSKLATTGHHIVIFSNRTAALGVKVLDEYAKRIETATETCTLTVYGSLKHDRFRKPHTGMWEHYQTFMRQNGYDFTPALRAESFYCGDAAGRREDFAASDAAFAHNINLPFRTAESMFPRNYVHGATGVPDPLFGYSSATHDALAHPPTAAAAVAVLARTVAALGKNADGSRAAAHPTCVVLAGAQGSGKSTLARRLAAAGYAVVAREGVTAAGVCKGVRAALKAHKNVVVDATHPSVRARGTIAEFARKAGAARVVIVYTTTPREMCAHLNAARCQLDPTNKTPEIPRVAVNTFWAHWEVPTAAEADLIIAHPFLVEASAPPEVLSFRY